MPKIFLFCGQDLPEIPDQTDHAGPVSEVLPVFFSSHHNDVSAADFISAPNPRVGVLEDQTFYGIRMQAPKGFLKHLCLPGVTAVVQDDVLVGKPPVQPEALFETLESLIKQ